MSEGVTMQAQDRMGGLGASDCAPALGLSKWKTPFQLYLEKRGEVEPIETTIPMMCGNALEPLALQLFANEMDETLTRRQERFYDDERPWRWVTPDAVLGGAIDWDLVDAKATTVKKGWGEDEDDVPMDCELQFQHGMAVTGGKVCWCPVLFNTREFKIYRVTRNERLIDQINRAEDKCWEGILAGNPPDPVSADDVRLRWPKDSGKDKVASDEIVATCLELASRRLLALDDEEEMEDLKTAILVEMGDATRLIHKNGDVLATFKKPKDKKTFNKSGFEVAHPETYRQFAGTAPSSRTFLLK